MAQPIDAERRLVAIFAADVEGYSRLMGADEVRTLSDLIERRAILDRLIASHRGRIANTAGDSVLAEFSSAVDAVECAVEAQAALARANASLSAERRINFRIGIHVGDVMVKGGDLFGDGVNIAARLQGIAKAGGTCLSSVAYDHVRKILPLEFTDLGNQRVKNIDEAVRAYDVTSNGATTLHTSSRASASGPNGSLTIPDRPSVAVLPFQNMSGEPEQEYFADGIVEDIITALSRFKSLFVIARNSTFTFKGKAVEIRKVGQDLGVRYVLEGSIRKAGGRVRLTGQLIDAASGAHLWADKFDGTLEDVFDLQDRITISVVAAIAPKLDQAEIERSKRKPTEKLDAYDYYLRGLAVVEGATKDENEEALRLFYKAIEIDVNFALPYAMVARCFTLRKANGWMRNVAKETAETAKVARRAAELGRDDAAVLSRAGYALARVAFEPDEGADLIERALMLNPHLASAWHFGGLLKAFRGEPEAAVEHLAHAMRLSPLDPSLYSMQTATALAHFVAGRYEESVFWAEKASRADPKFLPAIRIIATSAGNSGQLERAQKAAKRMLEIDPAFRVSRLCDHVPLRRPDDLARYAEGLRRAGLPE
ncbi:TolB-like protein/class 3 adenylate cyclase/Tfp pilus assembly protein PilF [Bradyrhizobium sp. USDA 3686]|uniref:adenylate/guanylate cyclase domain-containing protein n=1 Tax=Bradyrhizobium canariense TaxID=255045 RepID=UPI001FEF4A30|nr:adenylate/guanylate cyclase domain-containing protein [Bradyrhizobium canariense]MBM7486782.1 TolB-like protein/Tfp pilus assembly protein PilF [Bradyrhizobium canariense]